MTRVLSALAFMQAVGLAIGAGTDRAPWMAVAALILAVAAFGALLWPEEDRR